VKQNILHWIFDVLKELVITNIINRILEKKGYCGKMKNYLSFGGGVNSVAMYLHLMDQGYSFYGGDGKYNCEAIFVDHQTDWPETYEYINLFKKKYPLTVLKPEYKANDGKIYNDLLSYYKSKKTHPVLVSRNCTQNFKLKPIWKYCMTPAFMMIGFSYDERKRAKLSFKDGFENRFPLIENNINREECKNIIKKHGLPIPRKSGCYFCPFQTKKHYQELRKKHPNLFCNARQLEDAYAENLKGRNKKVYYIKGQGKSLDIVVEEKAREKGLLKKYKYPPCECML
jgi:3'-phosphoadenosine 5'-phosphosulfate sulfotransferase (PAPS reductase)/FAD synthetase